MLAAVFILRFLAFDFLAKMWFLKARSRTSLPEPVILTRLAVPLCVLSFGIFSPLLVDIGADVLTMYIQCVYMLSLLIEQLL